MRRRRWVRDPAVYDGCRQRFDVLGSRFVELLHEIKAGGGRIAAYGAAAKSTMLTNFFDIGRRTLGYVIDKNELE